MFGRDVARLSFSFDGFNSLMSWEFEFDGIVRRGVFWIL